MTFHLRLVAALIFLVLGRVHGHQDSVLQLEEVAKLTNETESDFADFGTAVAIDGNTMVAGMPLWRDEGRLRGPGSAVVFVPNGTERVKQAELRASNATDGDAFGYSVAIFEDTVVVGAPGSEEGFGAAHVFARSELEWTEVAVLTAEKCHGRVLLWIFSGSTPKQTRRGRS